MSEEILNVFEKQHLGMVKICDAKNIVEQSASSIFETLKLARDAERLAGKAGAKHVVLRKVACVEGLHVSMGRFPEVEGVGFLSMRIVVAGKYTGVTKLAQGPTKPPYTAKEVNKTQSRHIPNPTGPKLAQEIDSGNLKAQTSHN